MAHDRIGWALAAEQQTGQDTKNTANQAGERSVALGEDVELICGTPAKKDEPQ